MSLGQPVTFERHLVRQTERRKFTDDHAGGWWRVWKSNGVFDSPVLGIVIGERTLANGRVENDYEAGSWFDKGHAEHFKAYLVVFDMKKKPVYVLPDDLTKEQG